MGDPDQLLTASEAARMLALSRDMVRLLAHDDRLRFTRAANGSYRFRRGDVETLARERAAVRPGGREAEPHPTAGTQSRLSVVVRGVVQGVGFRPFVYGLASRLALSGSVRNASDQVLIEIEGPDRDLDSFVRALRSHPPPLARIETIESTELPLKGDGTFEIDGSEGANPAPPRFFTPDVATCDACLGELFDPDDRRYLYPFITCSQCGPRLTILREAPYDRARTTMAGFALCPACRAEYEDPSDRRFHAQPIACPACGPRVQALDDAGHAVGAEPISFAAALLRGGRIVAMKGLGGFHLACDATSGPAVALLRRRKHRDDKPFALMVRDLRAAEAICVVSPPERELLASASRPIVLLERKATRRIADGVAPGNPMLGVMLPYTPLHHLLLRACSGRPLIMTSGNRSDEPIAFRDDEAVRRLGGIADGFLTHDRPIHLRCDDSVARVTSARPRLVRRSRGHAPAPLPLPFACPRDIVALGGHLKNTFALGRGRHAFVSHHIGDLGDYEAYKAFRDAVAHYEGLFAFDPAVLVCDLHPGYATSGYAEARAGGRARIIRVQHHHAHLASCMADNLLDEPVIGVAFDGTGYGADGTMWGGEFLIGDYCGVRRAAHLRPVPLPGGEHAIRESWRMALSHLLDAGLEPESLLSAQAAAPAARLVRRMIERRLNSPPISSAGRLFDAVASLIGLRDRVGFEGQAAMELEWSAGESDDHRTYPLELATADGTIVIDTRPLIRALARATATREPPPVIARRFHLTLADMIATVARRLREQTAIDAVVLTGGVFMNALLLREATDRLERAGFRVYSHAQVPPGDGGLALGQLAVAAAQLGGNV